MVILANSAFCTGVDTARGKFMRGGKVCENGKQTYSTKLSDIDFLLQKRSESLHNVVFVQSMARLLVSMFNSASYEASGKI